MIYDRLQVALLSTLLSEKAGSPYALIAQYLLAHAGLPDALSVKAVAQVCHVGTGTVSRFAKDAGFASFADLCAACAETRASFDQMPGGNVGQRAEALARHVALSVARAAASVDTGALARLVADLHAYERVSAYGLLKANAAAIDLQVDMLMQGKYVHTCISPAEQAHRIANARDDELVIVFSYTGTYFDSCDVADALRRHDRPRIWMVSGGAASLPVFVHDHLRFASDHGRAGHPYQLECIAGIIAQEYAS